MAKAKGRSSRQPARLRPKPRNTVTLILDGTAEEVLENYRLCQSHFRYWLFTKAAFRVRVGDSSIMYTTPLDGTFYYAVRYKGRHLVFVIDARQLWLVGFFGQNGYYEMKSKNKCLYMDSPHTVVTPFDGNHGSLSHGGVGRTRLGLYPFRKAFDTTYNYHGPNYPEPLMLREAIDRIIIYIMETKFSEIYRRNCKAMTTNEFSRLGDDMVDSVVNWSSRSEAMMDGIVLGHDNEMAVVQTQQWLQEIFVLQVDATVQGFFDHAPLPPEPRSEVWCPIDIGEGDDDISNAEAIVLLPLPLPATRHHRATGKRGMKRGFSDINQVTEKRMMRGLRGGGVGGSPNVPDWFSNWRQELQDKTECDLLFLKSKEELDLHFIEAMELHLKQENKEKHPEKIGNENKEKSLGEKRLGQSCTTPPCIHDEELGRHTSARSIHDRELGHCTGPAIHEIEDLSDEFQETAVRSMISSDDFIEAMELHLKQGNKEEKYPEKIGNENKEKSCTGPAIHKIEDLSDELQETAVRSMINPDVQDLRGQNYLSDSVINRFFSYLRSVFPSEDILLVSPAEAMLYSLHVDAIPVNDISSHRLVLFPVNNNTQLDQVDAGTHWSLLVMDATTTTTPRLVHHDSSDGLNLPAARRLADTLCQMLPAVQETVVEANTPRQQNGYDCAVYVMAISKAIMSWWQARNGDTDWNETMFREVNASSVSDMRLELATMIEEEEANKMESP